MLDKNDKWSVRNPTRGASWLALVSLLWFQLTLASHQFEHVAEYIDDFCHVCAQLDRTDDFVVDVSILATPTGEAHPEFVAMVRTPFQSRSVRPFQSRAPPLL